MCEEGTKVDMDLGDILMIEELGFFEVGTDQIVAGAELGYTLKLWNLQWEITGGVAAVAVLL